MGRIGPFIYNILCSRENLVHSTMKCTIFKNKITAKKQESILLC